MQQKYHDKKNHTKKRGTVLFVIGIMLLAFLAMPAIADENKRLDLLEFVKEFPAGGSETSFSAQPAMKDEPLLLIRLTNAQFDPVQIPPADIRGELAIRLGGAEYYLVQFDGPVQESWRQALQNNGAELFDYIPDFAFIIRLDSSQEEAIRALPHVRWLGLYQPSYRISPDVLPQAVGELYLRGESPEVELRVIVFPGEDLSRITSAIQALGGAVLDTVTTSWKSSLRVTITSDNVTALSQISDVKWIEPMPEWKLFNDKATDIMGVTVPRNDYGLYGEGQVVGIADTGLDQGSKEPGELHDDFEDGNGNSRVLNILDLSGDGHDDVNSGHGTHVAGSVLGNGIMSGSDPTLNQFDGSYAGIAPKAELIFQAIEDNSTGSINGLPLDLNTLFQQADDAGAHLHTNSWGSPENGRYNSYSRDVDEYIWEHQDFLILFSAGNEGIDTDADGIVDSESVTPPATAKNCLTVEASENDRFDETAQWGASFECPPNSGNPCYPEDPISSDALADEVYGIAAFSSRGPTLDGRYKPDIVAPGTFIISTRSRVATETGWRPVNSSYMYNGGTSMATPLVAGAAALMREYLIKEKGFTNPSAALLKAALLNSAEDIFPGQYGTGPTQEIPNPAPNNVEGWGRLNLQKGVYPTSPVNIMYYDEKTGISTGEFEGYTFNVSDRNEPLKINLVWTDYPGSPQAEGRLNNDLDLEVIDPTSTIHYPDNAVQPPTINPLSYNDGNPENYYYGDPKKNAIRFTPPTYPATITSTKFWFYNPQSTATSVDIVIYSDDNADEPGGLPGSELYRETMSNVPTGWNQKNITGVQIDKGDFYIAIERYDSTQGILGDDENSTGRGYSYNGSKWVQSSYTVYITAYVEVSCPTLVDRVNNVEGLTLDNPLTGIYTVRVKGYNIPIGPQPYALVMRGELTEAKPDINIKQDATDIPSGGSYDYEVVTLGTSIPMIFKIENLGSAPLELTDSPKVNISGEDADEFVVDPQPSTDTIAPGESATFTIIFHPTGEEGTRTTLVSIPNNDLDEAPYEFTLTANVEKLKISDFKIIYDCPDVPGNLGVELTLSGSSPYSKYEFQYIYDLNNSIWIPIEIIPGANEDIVWRDCGGEGRTIAELDALFYKAVLADDPDNDSLGTGYEVKILGTDPYQLDSDGNGIIDADEDFDGDGRSNGEEYNNAESSYYNPCLRGFPDPNGSDIDDDGKDDFLDTFPLDPSAWFDNDCDRKPDHPLRGNSNSQPPLVEDDRYLLHIIVDGDGFGRVTQTLVPGTAIASDPLHCSSECSTSYYDNTQVTLSAVAEPGSMFMGWSGNGCSGTGDCLITITEEQTVTATFVSTVTEVSYFAATYGGVGADTAQSIQQTSDGGFIVAGNTDSFGAGGQDIWLLKLDSSGETSWQKTYGGANDDEAASIQQTNDGGYILAGTTNSFGAGNSDIWILKLDGSGEVSWQKTYGGTEYDGFPFGQIGHDNIEVIHQTNDGGYIVVGNTRSFGSGDYDSWLFKLDSSGNLIWQQMFEWQQPFSWPVRASVQQTDDSGYIVLSYSYICSHNSGFLSILKLDHAGNIIWQKAYSGFGSHNFHFTSIQQTSDGGYIAAAKIFTHTSDCGVGLWVLKFDHKGDILWQKLYNEDFTKKLKDGVNVSSIRQTGDGGYIVAGYNPGDVWLFKLDSSGDIVWQKTYGGIRQDYAHALELTNDGGYIVAGETLSVALDNKEVLIMKLNENAGLPDCFLGQSFSAKVIDVTHIGKKTFNAIPYSTNAIITTTNVSPVDTIVAPHYICETILEPDISIKHGETEISVGTTYDIGPVYASSSRTVSLSIENTGDALLNLLGSPKVEITGEHADEFVVEVQPSMSTIVPGASITTVEITFSPSIIAERSALVSIVNSDPDENPYTFTITGTGQEPPPSYFAATYGGSGTDIASSVQQTSDGGFIVAGSTDSFGAGGRDVWLLKLDSDGEMIWQKTYGGWNDDDAYSVQQTEDNDYIVVGVTKSFGTGSQDAWILKVDSTGHLEWQKAYGGYNPYGRPTTAEYYFIQQTKDGGYIAAGEFWGRPWIVKLESTGEIIWQKVYNVPEGSFGCSFESIQQTNDEGYIVAITDGTPLLVVLKLNSNGEKIWSKRYGYDSDEFANITNIQQTNDGGYIVAGSSTDYSSETFVDFSVLKLNSDGDVSWQKTYRKISIIDIPYWIQQTPDGNYLVSGHTISSPEYEAYDLWALQLGQDGNIIWQESYEGNDMDRSSQIRPISQGGGIIAGQTRSFGKGEDDVFLLKFDEDGKIPGCALGEATEARVIEAAITVRDASTYPFTDTDVTVTATTVIPVDTAVQPEYICEVILEPDISVKQDDTEIPVGAIYDIGSVYINSSRTVSLSIENTGNTPLTLLGSPKIEITSEHADEFVVEAQPSMSTIVPGTSITVEITFSPSSIAERSALVSIVNSDPDENPYTFTIMGTGQEPPPNPTRNYLLWTR